VGKDIGRGGNTWSGFVKANDGYINAIPCHSRRVLRLGPSTDNTRLIRGEYEGQFKWFEGVLAHNGCICSIPMVETKVLEFTTLGTIVDLPLEKPDHVCYSVYAEAPAKQAITMAKSKD